MIKATTIFPWRMILAIVLVLFLATILTRQASAQVALPGNTPQRLTDLQIVALIEQVKQMPVSRLDRGLPRVSFAKWLQAEAGPDARISWVLRYAKATATDGGRDFPTCVEADAMMETGRSIVILIGVGGPGKVGDRKPFVYRADLMDQHDSIGLNHLRDIPAALSRFQPTASH